MLCEKGLYTSAKSIDSGQPARSAQADLSRDILLSVSFLNFEGPINPVIQSFVIQKSAEPHSSVGSVQNLRTWGCWFDLPARPIFFTRIDDSHCDRIHSTLTAVHCFGNGYVGNQPVAWKEYCAEFG